MSSDYWGGWPTSDSKRRTTTVVMPQWPTSQLFHRLRVPAGKLHLADRHPDSEGINSRLNEVTADNA